MEKQTIQYILNTMVKAFLFPLLIVGFILRIYDKILKKEKKKTKRVSYNLWY